MRYGRHTSTEYKVLAIVMVVVWALTALFTPQIFKMQDSVKDAIMAVFKR